MNKTWISTVALIAFFIMGGCTSGGSSTTSSATPTNALVSIAVTPAGATIPIGGTQQFTATGTYADGTSSAITTGVTWTATEAGVSAISASGLATGSALGSATVTAKVGNVTGDTTLTVQGPYVKVAAGGSHTAALKSDGTLVSWGWNRSGQLGDGTANDRLAPISVVTTGGWTVVSSGKFHTVAIRADGGLWAWGFNQNGQLGDGTFVDRMSPKQVGTDKTWVAVSAGEAHTVALKKDGTAWAWGRNFNGQLGDKSYVDRTVPTKVFEPVLPTGFTTVAWTAISAGSTHTVGRRADGTIWSWGNNDQGQLGQYPVVVSRTSTTQPTSPVLSSSTTTFNAATKIKTTTVIAAATKDYYTTTTTTDFSLAPPTGINYPIQITSDLSWVSGPEETWVAVSAGGAHTIAIRADGALFSWGANAAGQLGTGNNTTSYSATHIGTDTDWAIISAGGSHSLAVKSDGTLWAWGSNSDGQLGVGDSAITVQSSPLQIDLASKSKWTALSAGLLHTFAIKSDGTLWGWGRNTEGQQGNGAIQNLLLPTMLQ